MPAFNLKCKNTVCGSEFHRFWSPEEFDQLQYGTTPGISCFNCGTPQMIVMRSNRTVKDGFQPGFQRNIRKHCNTYGEYKAHLKNMGLVELGYEDLPEKREDKTNYWTDEMLRKIYNETGVKFSDREATALKEGELN